jgi:hypothetical protein
VNAMERSANVLVFERAGKLGIPNSMGLIDIDTWHMLGTEGPTTDWAYRG